MVSEEHTLTSDQLARVAETFGQVLSRLRADPADFVLIPPPGEGESGSPESFSRAPAPSARRVRAQNL